MATHEPCSAFGTRVKQLRLEAGRDLDLGGIAGASASPVLAMSALPQGPSPYLPTTTAGLEAVAPVGEASQSGPVSMRVSPPPARRMVMTATRPATEPLFLASMRISFSPDLRNSFNFALVGWSQLVFSATFRPLMKAVAPLSQVKSILADLTAPETLKVLRKVAFSPSFACLLVQIHWGAAWSGRVERRGREARDRTKWFSWRKDSVRTLSRLVKFLERRYRGIARDISDCPLLT